MQTTVNSTTDTLMTINELSERIQTKVATIRQWRTRGKIGPRSIKVGGSVKYRLSDVNEWLASQTQETLETREAN